MQNLKALAGARGWPWRVDQVETFGTPNGPRLLHLSRPHAAGTARLVAIRPHEPVAPLDAGRDLLPMTAMEAAAIAAQAWREARPAFGTYAAARLTGDIHPWQLCAPLAFARGHARVLLADEAGMGKTVSAALAIADCLDAASDRRCLVLAPGHLIAQWRAELRDRLRIDALVIDAATQQRLQHALPAGVTPWSLPGCLLASLDFFKQPHILRALATVVWDLMVVDEAHLACGLSERHAALAMVARRARQLLLLTATPSDGGGDRLHALLTLGAARHAAPIVRLRHEAAGRARVERTLRVPSGRSGRRLHDALSAYARWISGASPGEAISLLCSVLIKRALSSAHALHLSLMRRHALLGGGHEAVQPSLFDADDDAGIIGAASGLPVDRERRRLDALIDLAARAGREDRRLRALGRLIRRAGEPAVIFTCFRDTAVLLASTLAPHAKVRLIHGALPQAVIDAALRSFTSGDAGVLVATDVAAQGLNLHQRCRWVIHYDLPWRPPTIRQRTGRVDRLGQGRRVHATFLLDRGVLSSDMHRRLASLTERMHQDEQAGSQRWDRLAAAEALRLNGVRGERALPPLHLPSEGSITVVEIDGVDAAGASIDRRVFALRTDEDGARAWARAFAKRRHARLRRPLAARASRRIARERAVLDAALETVGPVLRQDGLFERRADRGRAADAVTRARLIASSRDAIDRHTAESRTADVRLRIVACFAMAAAPKD